MPTSPFTPPAYTTVSSTPKLLVPIWGVPVRSILFVGLCESFATFCLSLHAFDASVGLSSPSGWLTRSPVHLAGKFGDTDVTDGFSRVARNALRACTHARHVRLGPWSFPPAVLTAAVIGKSFLLPHSADLHVNASAHPVLPHANASLMQP